jgi:hypothetical protein
LRFERIFLPARGSSCTFFILSIQWHNWDEFFKVFIDCMSAWGK